MAFGEADDEKSIRKTAVSVFVQHLQLRLLGICACRSGVWLAGAHRHDTVLYSVCHLYVYLWVCVADLVGRELCQKATQSDDGDDRARYDRRHDQAFDSECFDDNLDVCVELYRTVEHDSDRIGACILCMA